MLKLSGHAALMKTPARLCGAEQQCRTCDSFKQTASSAARLWMLLFIVLSASPLTLLSTLLTGLTRLALRAETEALLDRAAGAGAAQHGPVARVPTALEAAPPAVPVAEEVLPLEEVVGLQGSLQNLLANVSLLGGLAQCISSCTRASRKVCRVPRMTHFGQCQPAERFCPPA